ncbi:hypothetical protein D3C76_1408870 [compost metagenome]
MACGGDDDRGGIRNGLGFETVRNLGRTTCIGDGLQVLAITQPQHVGPDANALKQAAALCGCQFTVAKLR